ncbi:unnamed protein product [Effrenium voratum]|uniref:Uncharacterized protein n=1 Tax=Effrenium voratum TaxID=2562239 RepID=A0AA36HXZ4_9DINO|nr:unnamed protein product [Effrenium voratum]
MPATSGAPTKKPAANKLTINAMVDDIKTAASSKDDEEENQLRDKGKAEKFGKLMKAGALPLAVVHMWQIESKKAQSQRQFQTNLINGLFNKQTDGSYKMNTESHQFKEYQKIYVQHVAKDKKKGMPRGIMLASVFHGDSRAMEASLAKGELQSHKDDAGMEYLSFRELQTMEVKTNERGETVEGSKKLKSQEAHTLAGLMSKMKWEWVCKEDAHLPEGFLKTLGKAATACDKLLKEGLKLSKERGLAEKEGALKAAYADLTKHQSQIEHVKTWKELPNTDGPLTKGTLDNFLLDIARDVDKYNREIESVKGILKARQRMAKATANEQAGTNGAYKNKCHADLMNKVEHLSQLPEPFRVRVPFALPFGESLQGMLLPHQLFASLWRDYPETWRSSVLPDEQTLQRFWSAVDSHPQMESHPIRDVADYKSKVVPLAVHGDGVPVVGMLLEVKGTGWQGGRFPKLRGKAAEVRHFGAALHALWNAHMNPHLILHRRINLMLQLNCQLENMITEYKDDFAFPPGPAEDFENTCTTMLQLQTQVAEHFLEEGIAYFDVTSKCHMLQELAILARHINPRLIWVFCGEDMMQKMQQVAQSCTRGNTPGQTNLKMARHYRLGLHVLFKKRHG